jgi:hypothetical protein
VQCALARRWGISFSMCRSNRVIRLFETCTRLAHSFTQLSESCLLGDKQRTGKERLPPDVCSASRMCQVRLKMALQFPVPKRADASTGFDRLGMVLTLAKVRSTCHRCRCGSGRRKRNQIYPRGTVLRIMIVIRTFRVHEFVQ